MTFASNRVGPYRLCWNLRSKLGSLPAHGRIAAVERQLDYSTKKEVEGRAFVFFHTRAVAR